MAWLELVRGLTGVCIATFEGHLEDTAVEAGHVDGTEPAAVDRHEHVPRLDDVGIEVLEAELADLLVDADPQGQGTVLDLACQGVFECCHSDRTSALVVAAHQAGAVVGQDVGTFETDQVGRRDDDVVVGQLDVAALVMVDDRIVDLAGDAGVGIHVEGQSQVRGILHAGGRRDLDQQRAVGQSEHPIGLGTHLQEFIPDVVDQYDLARTAGMRRVLVLGVALDRSRVEGDVMQKALDRGVFEDVRHVCLQCKLKIGNVLRAKRILDHQFFTTN